MFGTIRYLVRIAAHDAKCFKNKQWFYEICKFYAKIIVKSETPIKKLKFGLEIENELSIQVVYWGVHKQMLNDYDYDVLCYQLFNKLDKEIVENNKLSKIINKHRSNVVTFMNKNFT